MAKVKVVQMPDNEIPTEVMADSIVAISAGVKKLLSTRLNRRALLLLIQDATPAVGRKKIGIKEIDAVLEGMELLEATFLLKKKGAP